MLGHSLSTRVNRPCVLSCARCKRADWNISCSSAVADSPHLQLGELFTSQPLASAYSLGEILGSGSFGVVHAAVSKVTGEEFAVKVVAKTKGGRRPAVAIEVENWARLQHCRHVARLQGVYEDSENVNIVQEICYGGNLQELLDGCPGNRLDEVETAQAMQGILEFLSECHSHGICYGDVKPANFLLKTHYPSILHIMNPLAPKGTLEVKAVDFGSSQQYDDTLKLRHRVGTPLYMAPEMFVAAGRYGLEVDMWAAGITMYQLLTGRFPFWPLDGQFVQRLDQWDVLEAVRNLEPDFQSHATSHISAAGKDLLRKLLVKDAGMRITAANALQHPWLQTQLAPMTARPANNVVPYVTANLSV